MSFLPINMFIALNAEIEILVDWSIFSTDDVDCPGNHTTCEVYPFVKSNKQFSVLILVQRGSHLTFKVILID